MSDDEADESEVPTILPKNKPSASYKRSPSSENEEQLLELLAGRLLWQEKWSKMTAAYWSKLPQNLLRNVELHLGPISLDNAATIFLKTDEAGMVRTGTAMSRVVQGIKNHAFKHLPGARAMDAIATDRLSSENMTYYLLGTTNFPQATLLEGDQSTANMIQ